jgi:hypothetical protein
MHDAISLESLGVPSAVIITSEFVREAELQRAALGMNAIAPVVIDHPLSTLDDAAIRRRAAQALPGVVAALLGLER